MSFSAFIGFQGWNSWTSEASGLSASSRSATADLLLGWFLASSLGGLMSMRVSRLELSWASRLRSEVLSSEFCWARQSDEANTRSDARRANLRMDEIYSS